MGAFGLNLTYHQHTDSIMTNNLKITLQFGYNCKNYDQTGGFSLNIPYLYVKNNLRFSR